jgi:hypothetical protein
MLSQLNKSRIAWTPALRAYFAANFVQMKPHWNRMTLYKRNDFDPTRREGPADISETGPAPRSPVVVIRRRAEIPEANPS